MMSHLHKSLLEGNDLKSRILKAIRSLVLSVYDPIVTVTLDKTPISLPLSHNLPLIKAEHKKYDTALPRVVNHFARRSDYHIVDVGANVGDTVISIIDGYKGIHDLRFTCVEGDDEFFDLLKYNTLRLSRISLHKTWQIGRAHV